MDIVAADPHARVLSEDEVMALRLGVTKTSVKARRLRAEQRAYFTVDTGSG
jgi:hypothetical protein